MPKILLPIPDDWNGTDWFCTQVQWPKSDKWTAILIGLLSQAARGRLWDEKTGSVRDAQQVGRAIFDRNYPFVECGNGDNGDNGTAPPTGGCSPDEIEEEMPGITWLEIGDDGVLYMYFGPCCKIAVEGEFTTLLDPPPVDPPEEDEGDPPTWACNKSAGMALRFWTAAEDGITAMGAIDAAHRAQALVDTLPQFNISQERAKLCALAYTANTVENQAMLVDEDTEGLIRCVWATSTQNTNSLSDGEWATMQSVLASKFTADQQALLVQLMLAMKQTVFTWWAGAYAETVASCECPDAPVEASPIWFNENTQGPTGGTGCVMEAVEVVDSGRRVKCQLGGSEGVNRSMEDFDFGLSGANDGDSIKFRIYLSDDPELTYMPSLAWQDYETPAPEADWHPIVTQPPGLVETRENGTDWVEWYNESEVDETMLWCRMRDARFYPFTNDPNQGGWRTYFYIEIVEVNGVPLTPLGP